MVATLPHRTSNCNLIILVDTEDLPILTTGKWYIIPQGKTGGNRVKGRINGKKLIYLHRFLMNAAPHEEVDHIDGNPLNNQKSNLRLSSKSENQQNRIGPNKNSSTGIRNIHIFRNGYRVQIEMYGKKHVKTGFNTIKEADDYLCLYLQNISLSA